jgi:hypothetical protein
MTAAVKRPAGQAALDEVSTQHGDQPGQIAAVPHPEVDVEARDCRRQTKRDDAAEVQLDQHSGQKRLGVMKYQRDLKISSARPWLAWTNLENTSTPSANPSQNHDGASMHRPRANPAADSMLRRGSLPSRVGSRLARGGFPQYADSSAIANQICE